MIHAQLPLDVTLDEAASFSSFLSGQNREAVERLENLVHGRGRWHPLFFWGPVGAGKSHLLQAGCRLAQELTRTWAYVPLRLHDQLSPGILENREDAGLVFLDDLDDVAGNVEWEGALFALQERLRAAQGVLICTANVNPAGLGLRMPELQTRLGAGLVYQLQPLDDDDKVAVLRVRAQHRGLEMSEEVARYVLSRYPRDMHALFTLLDRLDHASLARQRRLTIPFLRSLE